MAIRDTDISDWSTTASENPPEDGTLIGRDLAGQFRNIKSIVRSESLNKQWIKLSDTITTTSSASIFTATFPSTAGNLVSYFGASRKVRLTPTSGTGTIYCGVIAATFSSNTNLSLSALDGAPVNSTEYMVAIGTEDPGGSHLPAYGQAGSLTIAASNSSGTYSFSRTEADTAYFVKTTLISTNSAVSGANVVVGTTKNAGNCVITLGAAPGGSTQTVIGVTLLREM